MASHDKTVAPDLAAIPPLMEWIEQRCQEAGIDGDHLQGQPVRGFFAEPQPIVKATPVMLRDLSRNRKMAS